MPCVIHIGKMNVHVQIGSTIKVRRRFGINFRVLQFHIEKVEDRVITGQKIRMLSAH
jgi:hypothetical protein